MPLLIRIDVDRPYGKRNLFLQSLSRITSDFGLPRIECNFYLNDLYEILEYLNNKKIRVYIFFRKITVPTKRTLNLIISGDHIFGLHLENSRTYEHFKEELKYLEKKIGKKIKIFSKHGSGKYKYGFNHYAPYEPQKYIEWGLKAGMNMFLGNGEDPTLNKCKIKDLTYFPSAFWLEPYWRDCDKYTADWLIEESRKRDLVLLFHPDNVIYDRKLFETLDYILDNSEVKTIN